MKTFAALLAAAGIVSAQSLADVLAANNSTLSTLASLVSGVPGLLDTLSQAEGITILAPTNEAFEEFTSANEAAIEADPDLVAAVLQYHVLNGTIRAEDIIGAEGPLFPRTLLSDDDYEDVDGTQYLEVQGSNATEGSNATVSFFSGLEVNSTVVTADVNFTGGVIHVIDRVLALPVNISTTASAAGLSSLAGALNFTGLLETVNELENITVFAPTNEAFQNIASILSNATNETVISVLTYHVVNSSVIFSTDLTDGAEVPTLNGESITVREVNGSYFVNNALITTPNILVSNGVLHLIDQVISPLNATAAPAPDATEGSVAFEGAEAGPEPPLTSGQPTPTTTIAPPTGTGAVTATSTTAQSTGAAGKMGMPIAGAIAGFAAFLI